MSKRILINVDFFSDTHRLSCRVEIGATGLLGLLNDVNLSVVEARDMYISRLSQPAKIIANFETATLNKTGLMLAILARREDVGPTTVGYTRLIPYPVLVTMPAFEIRCQVEFPGKLDAGAVLAGGSGKYIPLYFATAVATQYPEKPYAGEAMLVNRTLVEAMASIPKGKA